MNRFIFIMLSLAVSTLFSCKNEQASHSHSSSTNQEVHDHDSHAGHNHDSHEGHDHEKQDVDNHEGHDHDSHAGHDHEEAITSSDQLIEISAIQMKAAGIRVTKIVPESFYSIIKTSGIIESIPSEQIEIVALHDGIIDLVENLILKGKEVQKDEALLRLSADGLTHDNFELGFREAERNFFKLQADFKRAKALLAEKIMSEKDFLPIELAYKNARSLYQEMKKTHTHGGLNISSPISGYISEILVKKGQFVRTGDALLRIQKTDQLILSADLPQKYWSNVKNIASANFTTASSHLVFNTADLDGKLVATGKSVSPNNAFIPISFQFQSNDKLIPGAFCKVFLKTHSIENALTIPNSALLEEMGHYYVFVRLPDGHFTKKEVIIGGSDGKKSLIIQGIRANDKVVYKGTFQVKMASISTAIPHGHAH